MSGFGSSSSSYSKACLLFRSGEERPSSGGRAEAGEEYLDSGALVAAKVWSLRDQLSKAFRETPEDQPTVVNKVYVGILSKQVAHLVFLFWVMSGGCVRGDVVK
jgi:hypothetical protein